MPGKLGWPRQQLQAPINANDNVADLAEAIANGQPAAEPQLV